MYAWVCLFTAASSQMKVWVKLEEYDPEKVLIKVGADIDDLKEVLKDIQVPKRNFYAFFQQSQLTPCAAVPSNTSCDDPIVIKQKQSPQTIVCEFMILHVVLP